MTAKKKKKYVEKSREWEKDRREKLNVAFNDLGKLLPQYNPNLKMSKIEILTKTAVYVKELQQLKEEFIKQRNSDTSKTETDCLKNKISNLLKKTKLLTEALTKAGIKIPVLREKKKKILTQTSNTKLSNNSISLETSRATVNASVSASSETSNTSKNKVIVPCSCTKNTDNTISPGKESSHLSESNVSPESKTDNNLKSTLVQNFPTKTVFITPIVPQVLVVRNNVSITKQRNEKLIFPKGLILNSSNLNIKRPSLIKNNLNRVKKKRVQSKAKKSINVNNEKNLLNINNNQNNNIESQEIIEVNNSEHQCGIISNNQNENNTLKSKNIVETNESEKLSGDSSTELKESSNNKSIELSNDNILNENINITSLQTSDNNNDLSTPQQESIDEIHSEQNNAVDDENINIETDTNIQNDLVSQQESTKSVKYTIDALFRKPNMCNEIDKENTYTPNNNDFMLNSNSTNFYQNSCMLAHNENVEKQNLNDTNNIFLPNMLDDVRDFSTELFNSFHVPPGGHHNDSLSPTAAFLLSFPLVSSSSSRINENLNESSSITTNDNPQASTPTTLLQIGNIDPPEIYQKKIPDNFDCLETINNNKRKNNCSDSQRKQQKLNSFETIERDNSKPKKSKFNKNLPTDKKKQRKGLNKIEKPNSAFTKQPIELCRSNNNLDVFNDHRIETKNGYNNSNSQNKFNSDNDATYNNSNVVSAVNEIQNNETSNNEQNIETSFSINNADTENGLNSCNRINGSNVYQQNQIPNEQSKEIKMLCHSNLNVKNQNSTNTDSTNTAEINNSKHIDKAIFSNETSRVPGDYEIENNRNNSFNLSLNEKEKNCNSNFPSRIDIGSTNVSKNQNITLDNSLRSSNFCESGTSVNRLSDLTNTAPAKESQVKKLSENDIHDKQSALLQSVNSYVNISANNKKTSTEYPYQIRDNVTINESAFSDVTVNVRDKLPEISNENNFPYISTNKDVNSYNLGTKTNYPNGISTYPTITSSLSKNLDESSKTSIYPAIISENNSFKNNSPASNFSKHSEIPSYNSFIDTAIGREQSSLTRSSHVEDSSRYIDVSLESYSNNEKQQFISRKSDKVIDSSNRNQSALPNSTFNINQKRLDSLNTLKTRSSDSCTYGIDNSHLGYPAKYPDNNLNRIASEANKSSAYDDYINRFSYSTPSLEGDFNKTRTVQSHNYRIDNNSFITTTPKNQEITYVTSSLKNTTDVPRTESNPFNINNNKASNYFNSALEKSFVPNQNFHLSANNSVEYALTKDSLSNVPRVSETIDRVRTSESSNISGFHSNSTCEESLRNADIMTIDKITSNISCNPALNKSSATFKTNDLPNNISSDNFIKNNGNRQGRNLECNVNISKQDDRNYRIAPQTMDVSAVTKFRMETSTFGHSFNTARRLSEDNFVPPLSTNSFGTCAISVTSSAPSHLRTEDMSIYYSPALKSAEISKATQKPYSESTFNNLPKVSLLPSTAESQSAQSINISKITDFNRFPDISYNNVLRPEIISSRSDVTRVTNIPSYNSTFKCDKSTGIRTDMMSNAKLPEMSSYGANQLKSSDIYNNVLRTPDISTIVDFPSSNTRNDLSCNNKFTNKSTDVSLKSPEKNRNSRQTQNTNNSQFQLNKLAGNYDSFYDSEFSRKNYPSDTNFSIPSTLPTLVGDLALEKNFPKSNILSVSQLVDTKGKRKSNQKYKCGSNTSAFLRNDDCVYNNRTTDTNTDFLTTPSYTASSRTSEVLPINSAKSNYSTGSKNAKNSNYTAESLINSNTNYNNQCYQQPNYFQNPMPDYSTNNQDNSSYFTSVFSDDYNHHDNYNFMMTKQNHQTVYQNQYCNNSTKTTVYYNSNGNVATRMTSHAQNSLTNFNLTTIFPEMNDQANVPVTQSSHINTHFGQNYLSN